MEGMGRILKRILLANILLIFVLLAAGSWAVYATYQRANYVTTDNARVAADMVTISSTQTSRLTDWRVRTGDQVHAGDILGRQERSATAQTGSLAGPVQARIGAAPVPSPPTSIPAPAPATADIKAPIEGTVLQTAVTQGQIVTQGQPLAVMADLSKAYILSYVDEDLITDVKVGHTVDITLDAFPDTKFSGTVSSIGDVAGNVSTSVVSSSSTTSPGRIVQRVPVRISIDSLQGKYVVPGMNAYVKIHK
jgi:multidrug resistance efflux pump